MTSRPRLLALAIAAAAALGLAGLLGAGCVSDGPPVTWSMCKLDTDCDDGETCDEHICWGNPPDHLFAAVVFPPATRTDLATTEIVELAVAADGTIENLAFAPAVEVGGRVVLAGDPSISIGATVVVSRASRIVGAPDYVQSTIALPDKEPGEVAWRLRLPPGETYDLIVTPDDGTLFPPQDGMPSPAELAPPLRTTITVDGEVTIDELTLGEAGGLKQIRGYVLDAAGRGLPDMVITAYSRFVVKQPPALASSLATSDESGHFIALVPIAGGDLYSLHVDPGAGVVAPSLVRAEIEVADPPTPTHIPDDIPPVMFPHYAAPTSFVLDVRGTGSSGTEEPVAGAVVELSTMLEGDSNDTVTFRAAALVGLDGLATMVLLPGGTANRVYTVEVVPPPSSPHAAIWSEALEVGAVGGVLEPIRLGRRVVVTGFVVDQDGAGAAQLTVRASPAPSFLFDLSEAQLGRVNRLGWPETQTDPNGGFLLYLDGSVVGASAAFDLDLVPPVGSLLPRWSVDEIDLADAGEHFEVGAVTLPDPSYARGSVSDTEGETVEAAVVWVYDPSATCRSFCDTAHIRATARSGKKGAVTLVLPSP